MQIYRVGGCVRDKLLGQTPADFDYLVVGATFKDMLDRGFRKIGADFPVFLAPQTQDEYALARTERCVGKGHLAFKTDFSPSVTLEEDLLRRDLTINAMAMDDQGVLYDPYGGQQDLERKLLRHVSSAFEEDPLRILRVARFMARLGDQGFTIAPETLALMTTMAARGDLRALPGERIWKETSRALMEPRPDLFFQTLKHCQGLSDWFPELEHLVDVPQPPAHHPEGCAFTHTLLCLRQAQALDAPLAVRWAVLLHDLGKGTTSPADWPKHIGHEKAGLPRVERACERLKVAGEAKALAKAVAKLHLKAHVSLEMQAKRVEKLFTELDSYRKPARLEAFLLACQCDARGRAGKEQAAYPQADWLRQAFAAAKAVDVRPIIAAGYQGEAIQEELRKARVSAIKKAKREQAPALSVEYAPQ